MGNYITKYNDPSEALKKLYKFNNENLQLLKDNIFVELDTNINYDLYKSYDTYLNAILNFQNQLSSRISIANKNKLQNINQFCYDIKTKYNENYEKYNNQNKRRQEYKEEINEFSFNHDSYKIFNLRKNFTMDELKIAYRNLARIYHPDRPDGDENKFKYITKAYLAMMEDLKNKEEAKSFNELRQDSLNYFNTNLNNKNTKLMGKFDNKLFNKIYEDNKLYDVNDTGYGNWLKNHDTEKVEIENSKVFSNNFNVSVFNNIFDKKVNRDDKLVKFNIPKESNSYDMNLLGQTEIDSYSGGLFSNIYDLKDAFTLSNITNENNLASDKKIKKKDIENLKNERLKHRFFDDQDRSNYHNYINYNLSEEERRQEGLRKIDKQIEENYKKTNKKLLTTMFIDK